jgi:hypothetical protein
MSERDPADDNSDQRHDAHAFAFGRGSRILRTPHLPPPAAAALPRSGLTPEPPSIAEDTQSTSERNSLLRDRLRASALRRRTDAAASRVPGAARDLSSALEQAAAEFDTDMERHGADDGARPPLPPPTVHAGGLAIGDHGDVFAIPRGEPSVSSHSPTQEEREQEAEAQRLRAEREAVQADMAKRRAEAALEQDRVDRQRRAEQMDGAAERLRASMAAGGGRDYSTIEEVRDFFAVACTPITDSIMRMGDAILTKDRDREAAGHGASGMRAGHATRVGGDPERDIRVPRFHNEKEDDFLEWKAAAMLALQGKTDYSEVEKNRLLLGSMRKSAAIAVSALKADELTVTGLLRQMERLFVTEGGTAAARQQFRDAKQADGENIPRWHTRVVSLYRRAHPDLVDVDAVEELRERFIFGLRSQTLGREVMKANPTTVSDAMNTAARFSSVDSSFKGATKSSGGGRPGAGLYAMGTSRRGRRRSRSRSDSRSRSRSRSGGDGVHNVQKETRKCFHCGIKGHVKKECRKLKAEKKKATDAARKSKGGTKEKGKKRQQRFSSRKLQAKIMAVLNQGEEEESEEEDDAGNGVSRD